jgi:aryl-alcohol dehydrogenase-like predicted oxidoreductase
MEHCLLGKSGFKVPVLSLGTGTFGGRGAFFNAWGATTKAYPYWHQEGFAERNPFPV